MLKSIVKRHPIAAPVFLLALGLVLFFAIRLAMFAVYWADPEHRNLTPEPWMTPRYIAHSWGLTPEEVRLQVGISSRPDRRPTLENIAKTRDVPVATVLREINAYLATKRPNQ